MFVHLLQIHPHRQAAQIEQVCLFHTQVNMERLQQSPPFCPHHLDVFHWWDWWRLHTADGREVNNTQVVLSCFIRSPCSMLRYYWKPKLFSDPNHMFVSLNLPNLNHGIQTMKHESLLKYLEEWKQVLSFRVFLWAPRRRKGLQPGRPGDSILVTCQLGLGESGQLPSIQRLLRVTSSFKVMPTGCQRILEWGKWCRQ